MILPPSAHNYNEDVDELLSREKKLIPVRILEVVKKYRSMALLAVGLLSAGQLGVKSLEKDNAEAVPGTENVLESVSILDGLSDAEKQQVQILAQAIIESDGNSALIKSLAGVLGVKARYTTHKHGPSHDGYLEGIQDFIGFNRTDADGFWGPKTKQGFQNSFF